MTVSRPMPPTMPGVRRSASARLVSGPTISRSTGSAAAAAADRVATRNCTASEPARSRGLGRPRRAAQPVLAMDVAGVDPVSDQRLGGARVHLDVRAGDGEHRQHVVRRRLEADIAEHRGDGVGRAAGRDQQQQRLGVVDAAVGIEDQSVCHGHVGSELRQTTHHRPSRSRSSRRRRR